MHSSVGEVRPRPVAWWEREKGEKTRESMGKGARARERGRGETEKARQRGHDGGGGGGGERGLGSLLQGWVRLMTETGHLP